VHCLMYGKPPEIQNSVRNGETLWLYPVFIETCETSTPTTADLQIAF
jgi:hypothetical protein